MANAWSFVKERMQKDAEADSKNAGGWEAVRDMASMKISTNFTDYFIAGLVEYLETLPYPQELPAPNTKKEEI